MEMEMEMEMFKSIIDGITIGFEGYHNSKYAIYLFQTEEDEKSHYENIENNYDDDDYETEDFFDAAEPCGPVHTVVIDTKTDKMFGIINVSEYRFYNNEDLDSFVDGVIERNADVYEGEADKMVDLKLTQKTKLADHYITEHSEGDCIQVYPPAE